MRRIAASILTGLFVTLAVGCAKKAPAPALGTPPPIVEAAPLAPPPPPPVPEVRPEPAAALTEEELFARKTLAELNAEGPLSDVFFDVDESDLREDARATLQRHAQWLSRWASTRLVIEGHCDERGTAEYNLALGERRAASVQGYLTDLGVSGNRLLIVTKGKEVPACTDETEACWQRNRRGHFVITDK